MPTLTFTPKAPHSAQVLFRSWTKARDSGFSTAPTSPLHALKGKTTEQTSLSLPASPQHYKKGPKAF